MEEVLAFWFHEIEPAQWFMKDASLDEEMRQRFFKRYDEATKGELFHWRETIKGRLAEIILLDQFSRNFYREDPRSFAQDTLALVLAQEAIRQPDIQMLSAVERGFIYMPLMHSESVVIHEQALKLFVEPGLEKRLRYEKQHAEIIQKFGRYPHRNEVLGRQSTLEEKEYLANGNVGF